MRSQERIALRMYSRIIVPLDGSPLAEEALEDAVNFALLMSAPLHLLRIVDYTKMEEYGPYGLALEYGSYEPVMSVEERESQDYLESIGERIAREHLTISTEVRRGSVVREIVNAATASDLIIMASHGRSGITRWLLGSVAEDVIRNGDCPVLLVRTRGPENT